MKNEIKLITGNGEILTTPKKVFEMTLGNKYYKFAIIMYPTKYLMSEDPILMKRVVDYNSGRLLPIQAPNNGVTLKSYIDIVKSEIEKIYSHYGSDRFKSEFEKYEKINL